MLIIKQFKKKLLIQNSCFESKNLSLHVLCIYLFTGAKETICLVSLTMEILKTWFYVNNIIPAHGTKSHSQVNGEREGQVTAVSVCSIQLMIEVFEGKLIIAE